jgi:hypothetical protein
MIEIYPAYTSDPQGGSKNPATLLKETLGLEIISVASGRSALLLAIQALGLSRQDEILVPPFISQCVLSALSRSAFPTLTPSVRTKAVMVLHHFGFPQDMAAIEAVARKNQWAIVNNAAHALLTKIDGHSILEWGDVSAVSFSKFYPCVLGGGVFARRKDLQEKVHRKLEQKNPKDQSRANEAFEIMRKARVGLLKDDAGFEVSKIFGCLPDLLSLPEGVSKALPADAGEASQDLEHRKKILAYFQECFPQHVPKIAEGTDIAPVAVPVRMPGNIADKLSALIKTRFNVDAPVLHFDFNCNLLKPDYQKALIIGCHSQWNMGLVQKIGESIKDTMYERI